MKTTQLLHTQHREVDARLKRLESGGTSQQVRDLVTLVLAHAVLEQESVYPVLLERMEDPILGALEEHAVATYEVQRLLKGTPSEAAFRTKATISRQLIWRHVQEEEEFLFPRIEKALYRETSVFGALLERRFQELVTYPTDALLARLSELDPSEAGASLRVIENGPQRQTSLQLVTGFAG